MCCLRCCRQGGQTPVGKSGDLVRLELTTMPFATFALLLSQPILDKKVQWPNGRALLIHSCWLQAFTPLYSYGFRLNHNITERSKRKTLIFGFRRKTFRGRLHVWFHSGANFTSNRVHPCLLTKHCKWLHVLAWVKFFLFSPHLRVTTVLEWLQEKHFQTITKCVKNVIFSLFLFFFLLQQTNDRNQTQTFKYEFKLSIFIQLFVI